MGVWGAVFRAATVFHTHAAQQEDGITLLVEVYEGESGLYRW